MELQQSVRNQPLRSPSLSDPHQRELDDDRYLSAIIEKLRLQLPIQNPIPFFVHNNPLQNWEKYPFEEGLKEAVLLYENAQDDASRTHWREIEDFTLPIVMTYLDQDLSRWSLATSAPNLWSWFYDYVQNTSLLKSRLLGHLKKSLLPLQTRDPNLVILETLKFRMPNRMEWSLYLQTLLFHFKGWSGIINVLENTPHLAPLKNRKAPLIEWIALLVVTETALFQLNQPSSLILWDETRWKERAEGIQQKILRLKQAEFLDHREVINNLKKHFFRQWQKQRVPEPQPLVTKEDVIPVLFCIDDREESLRRSLELINPRYQTFGTVGFFGLDFSLQRPEHLIYQPQCPPVITPQKRAREITALSKNLFFSALRKLIPFLNESRFSLIEPLLALALWPIYALALILRTFSPGLYYRMRNWISLDKPLDGKNKIEFTEGYSLEEKAKIISCILKGAGFQKVDSPLVFIMAHAATTINNPFQKSYGCGACSGQSGFPNAKVFTEFANDPLVRSKLQEEGFLISEKTMFVATCHNTTSDEVHFEGVPHFSYEQSIMFHDFQRDISHALFVNQKERWQQFDLPTLQSAVSRSTDWSQPRPEFGHTGATLAIFGPRWLTKNFNLKRQSFLISYDPDSDPTGENLKFNILNALPVCTNIVMDYYTSSAFPRAFGAGSKLPLNIAAGLGLMTGSKGDLRIGLATQMVDQHEPKRLLAFVYAREEQLQKVLSESERLQSILQNNWIHLLRIDPDTLKIKALTKEIANEMADLK